MPNAFASAHSGGSMRFCSQTGGEVTRVGDHGQAGREAASRFVARVGLVAVFLLHHIAGFSEVGDDAVGAALGDAHAGRDVARSRARVVGDAQQHPGVAGQETLARHP